MVSGTNVLPRSAARRFTRALWADPAHDKLAGLPPFRPKKVSRSRVLYSIRVSFILDHGGQQLALINL